MLIHQDTHRGQPDSVHAVNTRDSTKEIIAELEADAIVIWTQGEQVLASNPQLEHWRDYIAACYARVKAGQLEEGVGPRLAEQEIAAMQEAFLEDEVAVLTKVAESYGILSRSLSRSIEGAFALDSARLSQALSRSNKDGDPAKHAGQLQELRRMYEHDSEWKKRLGSPLGGSS